MVAQDYAKRTPHAHAEGGQVEPVLGGDCGFPFTPLSICE
jgi:hypothetical protein